MSDLKQIDDNTGLSQLRDLMFEHFTLSELKGICFDLNIDHEEALVGETKKEKIQTLTKYCLERKNLSKLISTLKEQRPKIVWPSVVIINVQEYIKKKYVFPGIIILGMIVFGAYWLGTQNGAIQLSSTPAANITAISSTQHEFEAITGNCETLREGHSIWFFIKGSVDYYLYETSCSGGKWDIGGFKIGTGADKFNFTLGVLIADEELSTLIENSPKEESGPIKIDINTINALAEPEDIIVGINVDLTTIQTEE